MRAEAAFTVRVINPLFRSLPVRHTAFSVGLTVVFVGMLTHQGRNNKVNQPLPLNPETVTLFWFDESSQPGAEDQSGVLILSETDKPAPRGFFLSDGGSSFPLLSVCWGFSV